jgi:hypothetical protein
MKNSERSNGKVDIHNADTGWTPRPAPTIHGHADRHQPGCFQCEALKKWTDNYNARFNHR